MTTKPVDWAKVASAASGRGFGGLLYVAGVDIHRFDSKFEADVCAERINTALSPLLARAELLEKVAAFMKRVHADEMWDEAKEILTSYASLPKMGESKEEKR